MHMVEITPTAVKCSCGFQKDTITGAEAIRLGYIHAGACTPAIVLDQRKDNNATR